MPWGSPPLTRGILLDAIEDIDLDRFTPAHAGNTNLLRQWLGFDGVHPRSRGEYVIRCQIFIPFKGSPPLTRGIHQKAACQPLSTRFTPAHAGNTIKNTATRFLHGVHPRSRGEYPFTSAGPLCLMGSPPLTRGIHCVKVQGSDERRFTPAHAGNT